MSHIMMYWGWIYYGLLPPPLYTNGTYQQYVWYLWPQPSLISLHSFKRFLPPVFMCLFCALNIISAIVLNLVLSPFRGILSSLLSLKLYLKQYLYIFTKYFFIFSSQKQTFHAHCRTQELIYTMISLKKINSWGSIKPAFNLMKYILLRYFMLQSTLWSLDLCNHSQWKML